VWAEEFSSAGARKFLVATCDAFARFVRPRLALLAPMSHADKSHVTRHACRYSSGPRFTAGRRHFYEVIPSTRACNLYVDVEWTRKNGANAWIDDDRVMRSLIDKLCKFISTVFAGVHCSPEGILHLESSTSDKFSRHLILNAVSAADNIESPLRAMFADNLHAGAFIADFISNEAALAGLTIGQSMDAQTLHRLHQENEAAQLFCLNFDGALTSCVDTGIYNKNRCFRLPLSSKCGKSAVLVPHSSNQMPLDGSDICLLKSSLVCPCDAILAPGRLRLLTHSRASKLEESCAHAVRSSSWAPPTSQRSVNFTTRACVHHSGVSVAKSIDDCILDDWAVKTGLSGQCCGIKASKPWQLLIG
jgi:hypothetical protein